MAKKPKVADVILVAEGLFQIAGIVAGAFNVFGHNYHTDTIGAAHCEHLIKKGWKNISATTKEAAKEAEKQNDEQ